MNNVIAALLGGGIGATARYLVSYMLFIRFKMTYWATFAVNVTGSFILGLLMPIFAKYSGFSGMKIFLSIGIAGSYTTFSTFSLENVVLFKENHPIKAFVYIFASVLSGMVSVLAGMALSALI